jgi:hypothetical protein
MYLNLKSPHTAAKQEKIAHKQTEFCEGLIVATVAI